MSVFRRGSVWWYEFRIRGQRVRASSHSRSRRVALRAEQERRRQIAEGIAQIRAPKVRTFARHAQEWLAEMQPHWHGATPRVYGYAVRQLLPVFGARLVSEITPQDIRRYQMRRHALGRSGATINLEIAVLRAVLRRTRLWANLQPEVRMLPMRRDVGRALTELETRRLLAACRESRSRGLYAAVLLSVKTGLRHCELRGLRWRAIDSRRRTLCVEVSKTAGGEGRVIPLSVAAWEALQAWRRLFPQARGEDFVFPAERAGWPAKAGCAHHVDPSRPLGSWGTAWRTARAKSGVRCRWHDLRHTFLSRIAENQVSDATIQALAGHLSARMKERYSHTRMAAKRRAVEGA